MKYLEKKELAFRRLDSTDKDNFSILDTIYPFSTENLNYFTEELLQGKRILLTGSSADQILIAQLYQAESITHFDLNPFAEFFYELKKAAIKELDIETFLSYFYYNEKEENSFSMEIYNQIRNSLSDDCLDFWDSLYQKYDALSLRKKLFQLEEISDKEDYKKFLPYLSRGNYEKLKKQDNFIPINFITCNVLDLYQNLKMDYDVIYFSDIFSQFEMMDFYDKNYLRKLYKFLNQILKYAKENGIILLDYFYEYERKEFLDPTKRCTHHVRFPIKVFSCQEKVSFQEIPTIVENSSSKTDTIAIYTKKKKYKKIDG